jgi:hypothetical protein
MATAIELNQPSNQRGKLTSASLRYIVPNVTRIPENLADILDVTKF